MKAVRAPATMHLSMLRPPPSTRGRWGYGLIKKQNPHPLGSRSHQIPPHPHSTHGGSAWGFDNVKLVVRQKFSAHSNLSINSTTTLGKHVHVAMWLVVRQEFSMHLSINSTTNDTWYKCKHQLEEATASLHSCHSTNCHNRFTVPPSLLLLDMPLHTSHSSTQML